MDTKNVGKVIAAERKARGMSTIVFCERFGFMHSYLSRVECGRTIPNVKTLERLAKALGMEAWELVYKFSGGYMSPLDRFLEDARSLGEHDRALLMSVAERLAGPLSTLDRPLLTAVANRLTTPSKK